MAMIEIPTKHGYLRLANDEERQQVAAMLFKNGYTVRTVKKRRDGKSFDKYVEFELQPTDIVEDGK